MTPARTAAVIAVFFPAFVLAQPPLDHERLFEDLRVKARTAYLTQAPIERAVSEADRARLVSTEGAAAPAARAKTNAEFMEALTAVKSLQAASAAAPLELAEKTRLMTLVHQRLGVSGPDAAQAITAYRLDLTAPVTASGGPTAEILRAAEEQARLSRERASSVMNGAGALRDTRRVEAVGTGVKAQVSSGGTGEELRASEFRPQYRTGPVMEMPSLPVKSFEPPTWVERLSAASKTDVPVPGLAWVSKGYNEFSDGRMKASAALDMEGAALLEKGGVLNTAHAGWKAAYSYGNRLVAGDARAVKQAAIGAAVVLGTVGAVVAAPLVGVGFGVVQGGITALSVYGMVTALPAFVKKPDYLNAATLVVGAAGAGYAAPLVKKTGELAHKGIAAVGTLTPKTALGASVVTAAPMLARAGGAIGKSTTAGVKVGHDVAVNAVTDALGEIPVPVRYAAAGPFELSVTGVRSGVGVSPR